MCATFLSLINLALTSSRRFSDIPKDQPTTSAPVIQHPTIVDEPAYKVTQGVDEKEAILTVSEVSTLFLKSLVKSAEDFLGRKVTGAVLTVPEWFDDAQRSALQKAAEDAGITVLQLLDEAGAALVATTARPPHDGLGADRTQLIVDLGQSALSLALLSVRHGLAYALATSSTHDVHAGQIDDRLIKFFAKEFTKKNKTPLAVAPAADAQDQRAEARLRLAIEHTKRTVSASAGAATCAVESLKDGLDYTGAINRMRFDMEAKPVYAAVAGKALALLAGAGLDAHEVDEIVYVGGSGCLPGLDDALAQHFAEDVVTPFSAGTIAGGGTGDPTTLLARGCALQADLLAGVAEDAELGAAFAHGSSWVDAQALPRTLGVLFPEPDAEGGLDGQWVPVVARETALPVRRVVSLDADLGAGDARSIGLEVWEVKEGVKVEKVKPPQFDEDDEEEEEEEEVEVKERTVEKQTCFGGVQLEAKNAVKEKGRWKTRVEVQIIVQADGAVDVSVWEVGKSGRGEKAGLTIAAP